MDSKGYNFFGDESGHNIVLPKNPLYPLERRRQQQNQSVRPLPLTGNPFPSSAHRTIYANTAALLSPHVYMHDVTGGGSPVWTNDGIAGGGGGGNFTAIGGVTANTTDNFMTLAGGDNNFLLANSVFAAPFIPGLNWNGMTIVAFIRTTAGRNQYIVAASEADGTPMVKARLSSDNRFQIMQLASNFGGDPEALSFQGAGGDGKMIQTQPIAELSDGGWHWIAFSYNGHTETWFMLVDGKDHSQNSIAGNGVGVFGTFTVKARIGDTPDAVGDGSWGAGLEFKGDIADLLMWGSQVSSGALKDLYRKSGLD